MNKEATDRPLHILHIIYGMKVGGAETMLVDIINGQIALGHKVSLIVVNDAINAGLMAKLDPRVNVICMNRPEGSKPLLLLLRLNYLILKLNPDAIHTHQHKFGRLVLAHADRMVMTVHDINTPMQYCARSKMVAITDAVAADIRRRVPDADVTTIYNGIRTADIPTRRFEPSDRPLRLVQIARFNSEKKGQDILVRALGHLHRRGIDNVEVTFIGEGPDMDMIAGIAREEGVADRVHFDGLRDRDYIYAHLHEYDAMCHPSRYEGFGLIIAEAMAAGLPLIVTHGDGPWEVADHGRLCLSFDNGDAASCADAIAALMADREAGEARAREAREYVDRYDIRHTVDNYIALYRKLR